MHLCCWVFTPYVILRWSEIVYSLPQGPSPSLPFCSQRQIIRLSENKFMQCHLATKNSGTLPYSHPINKPNLLHSSFNSSKSKAYATILCEKTFNLIILLMWPDFRGLLVAGLTEGFHCSWKIVLRFFCYFITQSWIHQK